jgi:hypothetical protein
MVASVPVGRHRLHRDSPEATVSAQLGSQTTPPWWPVPAGSVATPPGSSAFPSLRHEQGSQAIGFQARVLGPGVLHPPAARCGQCRTGSSCAVQRAGGSLLRRWSWPARPAGATPIVSASTATGSGASTASGRTSGGADCRSVWMMSVANWLDVTLPAGAVPRICATQMFSWRSPTDGDGLVTAGINATLQHPALR